MRKVQVSFWITVPDEVKHEDIEEWLKFQLDMKNALDVPLPLANMDLYDAGPRLLTIIG